MKLRNNTLLLNASCLVLAALSCALNVHALILPVAEDTSSTVAGKINAATGKAVTLSVTAKEQAFLTFDFSTLPATVTASNITSARLNLYVASMVAAGDLTVHSVTNAWQENTTSEAAPGYSSEVVGTISATNLVAKKFVEVDVTAAVSNWFNGSNNFGFAIVTTSGNLRLASKEGLGTGFPALLEIESSDGGIYFNGGNVGIGTAAPVTELQVNGAVTATSFAGNGSELIGVPNLQRIALLKWGVTTANNTFSVGSDPFGICFDGSSIWVVDNGGNNVTKLNPTTGVTIGTYGVGTNPNAICFDGANIWVANITGDNVTKLNVATGATIGTYSVGSFPIAICSGGGGIWVANLNSGSVTKLNPATGATIGTYNVGTQPDGLCFDGSSMWVANSGSGNVMKLSTNGVVIGTYSVGAQPQQLCFDGGNIWVANQGNNNVTKLNATTGAIIGTYNVGSQPDGICFDGSSIWVANPADVTVTRLNAATGASMGTYSLDGYANDICFDGANVWVANTGASTVTKF